MTFMLDQNKNIPLHGLLYLTVNLHYLNFQITWPFTIIAIPEMEDEIDCWLREIVSVLPNNHLIIHIFK